MSNTSLTVTTPVIVVPPRRDPHVQGAEDALKEALHHAKRLDEIIYVHFLRQVRLARRELRRAEEREREERARWS